MIKVVLTGGIASGKTTVSSLFEDLGTLVIDTDNLARELVEPGRPALMKIVEQMGHQFLTPEGRLDRVKMRSSIFLHPEFRQKLESILHPAIHDAVLRRLENVDSPYCILVIPLFAESSRYKWVDRILVVDVPESVQIKRVMTRDGVDRSHAEAILRAQASREERLALANDVIVNTGSLEELEKEVLKLHRKYLAMAANR